MRKKLLLLVVLITTVYSVKSQSCVPTTINNTIVNLACGQTCISYTYQVPHLKAPTDYIQSSIAYTPLPYLVAGGQEDAALYSDDKFSFLVNLPFSFCFFGASYSSAVVGSNGLITFDGTNQSCANAFTISPPIPFSGGTQCSQFSTYYPKAAIMAAYADLDPSGGASPPEVKIQWRVEGTAPCRKFVVSYYHIGVFGSTCGLTQPSTFQIICYESTGLIEFFFEEKRCVSSTNSGRTIMGIQDFTRTQAVADPAKNATVWNASNEGYRFTPNGGASNFVSAQLFTLGGTFIANADTATTVAGLLDINFPNVCPPNVPSTQFVIKTTFNSCNAGPLISSDTVTFNRITYLPVNTTTVPTSCGLSIGSITVTPTAGTSPYTYTLDGSLLTTVPGAHTYAGLPAGPHIVVVSDANGCDTTINFNINTTTTIAASVSSTATSCPLSADGTITVTPSSGTAPYSYSLDGAPSQPSNIFTNVVPGPHTVTFIDAMGCTGSVNVTVTAGSTPLNATVNATSTTCPTLNDGTITITPTSGTPAYQYRLDGGAPQGSNIFTNVPAGAHSVSVTDMFGCTGTFPANVAMGTSLTSSINAGNPPCFNVNNGSIIINPTSGSAPYTYSLNGGPAQGSNTFTGLPAGAYTISFIDANGCTGTNSVTLTTNTAITATAILNNPLCNGNNNGSINLNPTGGVAPYQYSINGGATYQPGALFTGLTVGTYNFLIKDALGCIYGFSYSLTEPTTLSAAALTAFATCPNNDGSIVVNAGGGTPAYQYSIDNGVNYQASNIFQNLAFGNYNNIKVKDANGCTRTTSAVVVLNDTMNLELGADSTICFGSSITLIPQTNALTDTFKWTPATTLNFDTVRTPVATPTDTTKYYLTAKWGICTRKDSVVIKVLHKPVAFAGRDTTICYKTNATLYGRASNLSGTVNYAWAPPDSLNTPNAATTIARIDTTRQFTLTVTDNYGCNFSVTDSVTVFMQPKLVVFAGNDTNAVLGKPHQLLASGGVNYVWSPAGPLNNPFIADPLAVLYNDSYFHVFVTDAIGCTDDDDVFIKVYEGPTYYLPNAFTPNGDRLNDIFFPTPVGIRSTDYFRVFDRYGALMFETRQWMKGWDGTLKGKPASSGTYVWMIKGIDKNGVIVEMKGTVLLLR